MKRAIVEVTKKAERNLRKIPLFVVQLFQRWVKVVEREGYAKMKEIKGHNDHALKGNRKGQRSVYLTRSYRVIYELTETEKVNILEVQEVNKHEYKK